MQSWYRVLVLDRGNITTGGAETFTANATNYVELSAVAGMNLSERKLTFVFYVLP